MEGRERTSNLKNHACHERSCRRQKKRSLCGKRLEMLKAADLGSAHVWCRQGAGMQDAAQCLARAALPPVTCPSSWEIFAEPFLFCITGRQQGWKDQLCSFSTSKSRGTALYPVLAQHNPCFLLSSVLGSTHVKHQVGVTSLITQELLTQQEMCYVPISTLYSDSFLIHSNSKQTILSLAAAQLRNQQPLSLLLSIFAQKPP